MCDGDATIRFVIKPEQQALCAAFEDLIDPPTRIFMSLFSDDSCISLRTPTGVKMFNMDISSCDASHTEAVFHLMRDMFMDPLRPDIQRLIDQCKLPIKILDLGDTSPRPRRVKLKPEGPRLYSGATITTVINNIANCCIGLASSYRNAQTADDIIDAARSVGYVITLQECRTYHDLQFLKHSPCRDIHGKLTAVLNLGVLIRATGSCHGDLPGRGPIAPRAKSFQHGLLRGLYPRTTFTFIENMKANFAQNTPDEEMVKFVEKHLPYEKPSADVVATIADDELYTRYSLTAFEVMEMNEIARHAAYNTTIACDALSLILEKDYGLSVATEV